MTHNDIAKVLHTLVRRAGTDGIVVRLADTDLAVYESDDNSSWFDVICEDGEFVVEVR